MSEPNEIAEDMLHHVKETPCCWYWLGPVSTKYRAHGVELRAVHNRRGRGTTTAARRILGDLRGRELEATEQALHRCDNPLCVRPGHLYVGSAKDNSMDARDRGRMRPGGVSMGGVTRCCTDRSESDREAS